MAETPSLEWEQKTIEKLLLENLNEQRRRRRWGILFKTLFFIFLLAFIWLFWPSDNLPSSSKIKKHISMIDVRGEIDETSSAGADNIISGLQQAFKDKDTQAVILRINSPGGSPVQSANVYNEILYQRKKHPDIKLYVVCSDVCASGAYYIASAADSIYANPSSLVGSIGVLLDGFGFVDGMHKLGIERRLLTAGDHKGFLDPFSPLKPDEQQRAQSLIDNVHQQFIKAVVQGRGQRLKNDPQIFSGLVWTGEQALPLGLIDGFGDVQFVARNIIKNDNIVDSTVKPNFFDLVSHRIGTSFASAFIDRAGFKEILH